jgi:3-hydroxybutyryl-CoA dehydrogenase
MPEPVSSIGVCGAGTMGAGIAQVAAQAGFPTIVFDKSQTALEKAKSGIEKTLAYLAEKNKISPTEKSRIISAITFTNLPEQCKADLIIEAIVEDIEAKRSLFNQLASFNKADCIFASNTSSLSVSTIASTISHPERVAGMHFFNPPSVMKLVEVVKGKQTADEVIVTLTELVRKFGKMPVLCKDLPGFIVNRVARPYYLESLKLVEQGIADFETIDKVMEATGFKMGPFRLMDLIGNDINFAVSVSLYEAFDRPLRFQPSAIQQEKVQQGELGKKTGKGYYEY